MITSINTSRKQIPATIKNPPIDVIGNRVLNFGSGKYPELSHDHLMALGASEVVSYDPYAVNDLNLNYIDLIHGTFDVVFCCNVLNVVPNINAVINDLNTIDFNTLIVQIYEGDRTGNGKETRDGYQHNKRTVDYIEFFKGYDVKRSGNYLIIRK